MSVTPIEKQLLILISSSKHDAYVKYNYCEI